jgi:hypothetical protein
MHTDTTCAPPAPFTVSDARRVFLGKIVHTNYGTGPYMVTNVSEPCDCGEYLESLENSEAKSEPHVHLICRAPGDKQDSHLGGYRLDGTSVWNADTITVSDPPSTSDAFADEVLADDQPPPVLHRTSIRVGEKYYPARISEALSTMPDWRGEPEYDRLLASAGRDQKFLQPVLGKLVITGSKAMPVEVFEIEDGRHRFWAAEEARLGCIDGKVTEMPVAELMLRSLLERRHLEKGARAYLAWPVIEPFVSANKETRKSNLKRGKEKGEALRKSTNGFSETATLSDLPETQLSEAEAKKLGELAESYGISRTLLDQARRVHDIFARRKDLKAECEPQILAGELGLGACIAGVAGKEATEGKERKDTPPADLLRRSFRDLRIRFAPDRWNIIPDTDRHAVAGELVETVLDLPEDVRARLKTALA